MNDTNKQFERQQAMDTLTGLSLVNGNVTIEHGIATLDDGQTIDLGKLVRQLYVAAEPRGCFVNGATRYQARRHNSASTNAGDQWRLT